MRDWIPAFTGMTCLGLGAGLISIYGFFVEPLSREFSVGVGILNIGPVALLLVPGITGPIVGKFVDRVPIRRILLLGTGLAMGSLLLASQAPSLFLAGLAFILFALGLSMYGPVVVNGMLIKLYPGRAGRALAIAAIGISLATAIMPPTVGMLLANMDWRWALVTLASGVLALLWFAIIAGVPAHVEAVPVVLENAEKPASIYHDRAFWLVGLSVAVGMSGSIVLAIGYPVHFSSIGFSVAEAGWFISMSGVAGLVGKTLVASYMDSVRHYARWVAAGLLLLQAAAAGLLLQAETSLAVFPAACMFGFGSGAFLPMHGYLNSCYFDAKIIGQVSGAQMPLFIPFGAVGIPLSGYVYDQTGNYDSVFIGLIVAMSIAALMAAVLPRPLKLTTLNQEVTRI